MSSENEYGNRDQRKIVTGDKMAMDLDKFEKEYQSISTSAKKQNQDTKPESQGFLKRKYLRVKKAMKEFWVVGKYGFKFGFVAGGALGFLFGAYESIRVRSILPLPIAVIGSGFTFGCIFAISTVVRTEKDNEKELYYEVGCFDKNGTFVIKRMNYIENHKL
jgi:hypothetical protein